MQSPFLADRGFSLIEVLVALLITTIGILGITALQFKGMQYNTNASFRTQVSMLAYDISERMRINAGNAPAYSTGLGNYVVPTTEPGGCEQAGASSAGVDNDIACWKQQLYHALPPGSVARVTSDGAGLYTISIGWINRQESDATPLTIEYTFRP